MMVMMAAHAGGDIVVVGVVVVVIVVVVVVVVIVVVAANIFVPLVVFFPHLCWLPGPTTAVLLMHCSALYNSFLFLFSVCVTGRHTSGGESEMEGGIHGVGEGGAEHDQESRLASGKFFSCSLLSMFCFYFFSLFWWVFTGEGMVQRGSMDVSIG